MPIVEASFVGFAERSDRSKRLADVMLEAIRDARRRGITNPRAIRGQIQAAYNQEKARERQETGGH